MHPWDLTSKPRTTYHIELGCNNITCLNLILYRKAKLIFGTHAWTEFCIIASICTTRRVHTLFMCLLPLFIFLGMFVTAVCPQYGVAVICKRVARLVKIALGKTRSLLTAPLPNNEVN